MNMPSLRLFFAMCVIWPASSLALAPMGAPVSKISLVSNISTWQALDERRLVLSLNAKRDYLLTLTRDCFALPHATQLGVSASNNTVYAGFDYITADGERCAIKAINQLSKDEKRELTQA